MTEEQIKENITKLINHNGGYWIRGAMDKPIIGERRLSVGGIVAVVIAHATLEEAQADSDFLGLPALNNMPYWYRASID